MHTKSLVLVLVGAGCVAAGVAGANRQLPPETRATTPRPTALATEFVVRDVRVFDGGQVLERATVVVRDGKIGGIGRDLAIPAGLPVVDGTGRTLLPGLIDSHTHAFGAALTRALVSGVTTELDMFTDHQQAARWRAEQRSPAGAAARADIFSAGGADHGPQGARHTIRPADTHDRVAIAGARLR